tara:strand:- start:11507 stop:12478 length:972 start_codon:yes stop_codon:yes gene_type:complete
MHNKAVIIGCTGQDGSLMTKYLLKKGYEVLGTTRLEKYNHKNHQTIGIDNEFPVKALDLMDIVQVTKFIKDHQPTEIYNLSAQSSVRESFINPIDTFKSISLATLNILEACKSINFDGSLFFAGSSEVFGNTDFPATIHTNLNPLNPYGIAKVNSLQLVKMYRTIYGIKAVTGILFNHESSLRNEKFVTNKIIKAAFKSKQNNEYTIQFGNLNIARDWGWAEDYVEAMHLMVNRKKNFQDHVICTGKLTNLTDFIDKVFGYFNLNWRNHVISSEANMRKSDIIKSYGDPQEIMKDLNWKSKLNLDEIVTRLIKNYHIKLNNNF